MPFLHRTSRNALAVAPALPTEKKGGQSGPPWRLVVTDGPSPTAGRTYFVLNFSATTPLAEPRERAVTAGYEALAQVVVREEFRSD